MKITITNGPVLDTVEVDPEERKQLADQYTAALKVRGQDRTVSPDEIPIQRVNTYSLRYEQGQTYDVDPEVGGRFKAHGWAVSAAEDAKVARSGPFDTRKATDKQAEEWDAKAQERFEKAQTRMAGVQEPDLDVKDATTENGSSF